MQQLQVMCLLPMQFTTEINEKHKTCGNICVEAVTGLFSQNIIREAPTEPFSDNSVNKIIEEVLQLKIWKASNAGIVTVAKLPQGNTS